MNSDYDEQKAKERRREKKKRVFSSSSEEQQETDYCHIAKKIKPFPKIVGSAKVAEILQSSHDSQLASTEFI